MNKLLKVKCALFGLFLYYVIFALFLIVASPSYLAQLIILETPFPLWIFRLSGVILALLGFGILLPFINPLSHWGITFLILVGQIFTPLATSLLILFGDLPAPLGFRLVIGDLIFLPVSYLAIRGTVDLWAEQKNKRAGPPIQPLLKKIPEGSEKSLEQLSDEGPVLIVLLRHSGCTFCRATLDELRKNGEHLSKTYRAITVVLMGSSSEISSLKERYELKDLFFISDPDQEFYRALSIPVGNFKRTLGWKVISRGLFSGLLSNYGIGLPKGDPFQLPGSAIIKNRTIVWSKPAKDASETLSGIINGSDVCEI